jgi:hypothetical protein
MLQHDLILHLFISEKNFMKRIWFSYIVVWIVVLLLSPAPPVAWATNPTVTVTKTNLGENAYLYSISFSAGISSSDTVFIYNDASSFFAIDGVGKHPADSLITLESYSSETTADSVRWAIVYQVTSKITPTITAGTLPSADWITAYVDSVTLNNRVTGRDPGISIFPKQRLAGQATKMRIVMYELNTASPAKDATQTLTLRLVIPKRTVTYLWR